MATVLDRTHRVDLEASTASEDSGSIAATEVMLSERETARVAATEAERTSLPVIPIQLSNPEGTGWIADDSLVGQFGEGDSPEEAVRRLFESLHEYRDILEARRQTLSPRLKQHLAILGRYLDPLP
jgi:hypothetical protein